MSAEGKKKRGLSGQANAKTIPFRNGGSHCNYDTRIGRTDRTNGSLCVRAYAFGLLIRHRWDFPSNSRLEKFVEDGLSRCTHPIFGDADTQAEAPRIAA